MTFSAQSRNPSSCRLSTCSRLMLGWKAKSNCASVLTAGRREEAHGGLQPPVVAQRDLGVEHQLDRFACRYRPAVDLGHLPEHLHANVTAVLRDAWATGDAALAQRQLERLAASLETDHPGAAASVREGLADTLTLQRFGIAGALYTKLRTTNAIENFNGSITTYSRNVKRWRNGTMVVRWVSAAIVEAEKTFRRVHGWRDITRLVSALAVLEAKEEAATEQVA